MSASFDEKLAVAPLILVPKTITALMTLLADYEKAMNEPIYYLQVDHAAGIFNKAYYDLIELAKEDLGIRYDGGEGS